MLPTDPKPDAEGTNGPGEPTADPSPAREADAPTAAEAEAPTAAAAEAPTAAAAEAPTADAPADATAADAPPAAATDATADVVPGAAPAEPATEPAAAPPPPPPPPLVVPIGPSTGHAPFADVAPSRIVRWGYPAFALALFVGYLPTLSRGITFTDGPEILTAIHTLGVIHPTGYPVFTVVAHYFAAFLTLLHLPVLPCIKVELFNALCGVFGSLFTAYATRDLIYLLRRPTDPVRDVEGDLAGLVAGSLLGLSPLLWDQVRIPEVYPFHVFLLSCGGWAWIRFDMTARARYLLLAALFMGTGLSHHVTMVYMLGACAFYLLARWPTMFVSWLVAPLAALVRLFAKSALPRLRFEAPWVFPLACLCGFLPMLSYGYLIWANSHTSGLPWGDVENLTNLWAHMTGKQYQKFLAAGQEAARFRRVLRIHAVFDRHLLGPMVVPLVVGVGVAFARRWRPALFVFLYMLFNIGHGVWYSVGDYGNYFLPAVWAVCLFIGVGFAWAARRARVCPPEARGWVTATIASAWLSAFGGMVWGYARYGRRVPMPFGAKNGLFVALPLLVGAFGLLAWAWQMNRGKMTVRTLPELALPLALLVPPLAMMVPIGVARGAELVKREAVGENYGADVAQAIPRGAIFMTQGDGFLFTMWYEHHVMGRGVDFATLDMGNLRTPWYQRYLRTRYPRACDPLDPKLLADPAKYDATCGTFDKRVALPSKDSWPSIGLVGARATPKPRTTPLDQPILRGADPRCAEEPWKREHAGKECACWDLTLKTGVLQEECVMSAEEGGIVPRDRVEILVQRLIEDHIEERAVFERNVMTNWNGNVVENPRGWIGPPYQRLSADWSLVNRGRHNQIVWTNDVKRARPCAEAWSPMPLTPTRPPSPGARSANKRRPYVPNDWPTLVTATYLSQRVASGDDEATRIFAPGDPVQMRIDWYEKHRYDANGKDKHGTPIHHGVRVCFYEPSGKRAATTTVVSGSTPAFDKPLVEMRLADDAPVGTWHVQACSVGEVGEATPPLGDELACERLVLEYDFTVKR